MMQPRGKRLALSTAALALAVLAVVAWLSWPHLRFWWRFEPLGKNEQGLQEYAHRATGIVFVEIPAGQFSMGMSDDEWNNLVKEFASDLRIPRSRSLSEVFLRDVRARGPRGPVMVHRFLLAKYELCQDVWLRVMGRNPSRFVGTDLPVEGVTWEDCVEFCRKAGLCLPTEAQWEYACRASTALVPGSKVTCEEAAWLNWNSGGKTHPVGQLRPNAFGLFDMLGNVEEWCQDVWEENGGIDGRGPGGKSKIGGASEARVVRGGAWDSRKIQCRCESRGYHWARQGNAGLGLRPAYYPLP